MPLTPGTRLGPYEIVAPLGAGGMGEVFRAKDTRLGRDVAIKVLPQHLSASPEVRARFEREAKTVSSLNHPNICTLFDVGREGDTDYLCSAPAIPSGHETGPRSLVEAAGIEPAPPFGFTRAFAGTELPTTGGRLRRSRSRFALSGVPDRRRTAENAA